MLDESINIDESPLEWCIQRSKYNREEDGLYESLFALTNGRFGIRATVDFEAGGGVPGCFLSDLYGPGLAVVSEIVNALNFAYWSVSVEGLPLHPGSSTLIEFQQTLDLYQAAVSTKMSLHDCLGRTTRLVVHTLLPATESNLLLTIFDVSAVNHSSNVELLSGIDWRQGNVSLGGCERAIQLHHLEPGEVKFEAGKLIVCALNRGTRQHVGVVTRHVGEANVGIPLKTNGRLVELLSLPTKEKKRWTAVRVSAVGTGEEQADVIARCEERVEEALKRGIPGLLADHGHIWQSRWAESEIQLDGPPEDIQAFRFAMFHLLQAPDRHAFAANIPARGLTSEYHSGHFFFNTELFLVPYYSKTERAVARSLIMHRAATLKAARAHAHATGFDGARYPEEADLEGRPATPNLIRNPFTGQEVTEWSGVEVMHISADVLYGLSRYLDATGDREFVRTHVLEMVVDIARYCASLMKHDPEVSGRGARSVMCFDEFHYHVDHHWATNYLARWALRWAANALEETLRDLPAAEAATFEKTLESIGGGKSARETWRQIASEVYLPKANDDGVIPEFLGYFSLPDQLASKSPGVRLPVINEYDKQRMEALLPFETQLVKQADVVLLMALFPDSFEHETVAANFSFYDPRTIHASSLSMTPHASVAAQLGEVSLARHYLLAALRYNLDFQPRDGYFNGIHLAGYAGAFNALVEAVLGFRTLPDGISFNPQLPNEWTNVRLRLKWRLYAFEIEVCHESLSIKRLSGPQQSITVGVGSNTRRAFVEDESLIQFKTGSDRRRHE